MGVYILGFPNHEVRQALYEIVLLASMDMEKRYRLIMSTIFIALAVELDEQGKGLVDWKEVYAD